MLEFDDATVLIVDDIEENIIILSDLLEDYDYRVLSARSGEEVFAVLENYHPDLILLDVRMPGQDGFEICRKITAEKSTEDIPVIFMTALDNTSNKLEGFESGGVDYITKPFSGEEVLARVSTHLGLKRMREDLEKKNKELEKTKAQLEESQNIAKIGRWEMDLATNELRWSPGIHIILELDPSVPPSFEKYIENVHEDDIELVEKTAKSAFGEFVEAEYIYRLRVDSGRVKTVRDIIKIHRDENQNPVAVVGVTQDITEINKIEDQLRTLARAVEQSPISIIITAPDGTIEFVNAAFTDKTGYAAEEAIGQNPRILKSGLHPRKHYEGIWKTITEKRIWRGEVSNRKKNGSLYWIQAAIAPVVNEHGQITHFIGLQEDITRKKELESTRDDIDRIMRHDLKSPLNAIVTYPQLLKRTGGFDEKQVKFIDNIQEAGSRMLEMIQSYLNFYKIESGNYQLNPIHVDLKKAIQRAISDLASYAETYKVNIVFTIEDQMNPYLISGEETLLYSSISNLLKNAIEASPREADVQVQIDVDKACVFTRISNLGTVPEEIREYFFDKYVTQGKTNGTGLGTYSAKLISELHGGSIYLDTSDTNGTTVTIRFPSVC